MREALDIVKPPRSATSAIINSRIAERSIEQRPDAGADMGRQMLGGSSQQACQRNNGKSSRHEDQQRIGSKDFERDSQRDKDEQGIKPRREKISHA